MTEKTQEIVAALKAGEPVRSIAARTGRSVTGVHSIAQHYSIRVKYPLQVRTKGRVIISGRKLHGGMEPTIRVPSPLLRSLGWVSGERTEIEAVDGHLVIRRVLEGDMSDPAPKVAPQAVSGASNASETVPDGLAEVMT